MRAVREKDDQRFLGAKALGCACGIHRRVTGAIDYDATAEFRCPSGPNIAQKTDRGHQMRGVTGGDADPPADMFTDRHEHRVEFPRSLLGQDILNFVVQNDRHAHRLDADDFLHHTSLGRR